MGRNNLSPTKISPIHRRELGRCEIYFTIQEFLGKRQNFMLIQVHLLASCFKEEPLIKKRSLKKVTFKNTPSCSLEEFTIPMFMVSSPTTMLVNCAFIHYHWRGGINDCDCGGGG